MEFKFMGFEWDRTTDNPFQVWRAKDYQIIGSDSAGWALSLLDSSGEVGYGEYPTFVRAVEEADELELKELRRFKEELRANKEVI